MDTNRLRKQALQYQPKVVTTRTEDGHKQTTKQALQYKPKVTTTCTGDGHKQTTKTSTTISTKRTKEQETRITLQEHDDDDEI